MTGYRFILCFIWISCFGIGNAQTDKPNIIFIYLDDLNDYTEVYNGHIQSVTPAIAELAASGTTFMNAFSNSSGCMPSRQSMVSGKDLAYTDVLWNEGCDPFRDFFTEANGNPWVYTIAEVMKDSGGYFTYGINKIDHCYDQYPDFDAAEPDICAKGQSWNKVYYESGGEDQEIFLSYIDIDQGVNSMTWYPIPDSLETSMLDYRLIDTALSFIDDYATDPSIACDKPVFMMLGLRKPHQPWFIPEKYFSPEYVSDFYEYPFNYPYNNPPQAYPYNGVLTPPQPEVEYADYYALPDPGLGRVIADDEGTHFNFEYSYSLEVPLPGIEPGLSIEERRAIVNDSKRQNAVIAYMAAVSYIDAQIGRFLDSLALLYPDFYNNTIFVTTSDQGYSLGEKRNWEKYSLWETDLRIPLIINDMRIPPQPQKVYDAVGLIDIFPTMLDISETAIPMIDASTPYLDGQSLKPYLTNPGRNVERAIVSAMRSGSSDCNCFPQYSVRTERFHYIRYNSNNATVGDFACSKPNSFIEEELYEIGRDRSVDPNEWHNLINQPEYQPVRDYMASFLPDSSNYQKVLYSIRFSTKSPQCIVPREKSVRIVATVRDSNGAPVYGSDLANLTFTWTNSITNDTITGNKINFPMMWIDEATFDAAEHILFYLNVTDNTTGEQVAFDVADIKINPANIPEVDFSLSADGLDISVNDFIIAGDYKKVEWTVPGIYSGEGLPPSPLTVDDAGTYSFKALTYYGNRANCKVETIRTLLIDEPTPRLADIKNTQMTLLPNPADNLAIVRFNSVLSNLEMRMYSMDGTEVYRSIMENGTEVQIETGHLPTGVYVISCNDGSFIATDLLIITH